MPTTTIKVSVELRDRLAELASRDHLTLAGVIARTLDLAEDAAFWSDVAASMGKVCAQQELHADLGAVSGTLTDGLDPDESWDDVW